MDMTFSKQEWEALADLMSAGGVRFSTGHQYRAVDALVALIHEETLFAEADEEITIGLDWDSTLSVHQAHAALHRRAA